MIPYLNSSGIRYTRNTPDMTAGSSIRQANQGWYDFYLALHSNAAGEGNYGNVRGIIAFYYPSSTQGQRAAQIFVNNLREIYPLPNRVVTRSTTSLGEVRDSKFPAVLLELGYHDNEEDARWIENNITEIARKGTVYAGGGTLNLRSRPTTSSQVIASIPDGASVTVYGRYEDWYVVRYGDYVGYASAQYIK